MIKDDLIALGLRSILQAPVSTATPASTEAPGAPIERLLTLLRDVIGLIEMADEGMLVNRIEECRRVVASAQSLEEVNASIEACNEACREVLANIGRQRMDHRKEIASLVDMVREALAMASGDGDTFNRHLDNSMERFEALGRIDDIRLLKRQLGREIGALKEMTLERQKTWQSTCEKFGRRVEVLERQLTLTREEAALDPLTRISNRGGFDRSCREWLTTDHLQFVMALVDVDDFKSINDTHGHGVGDRTLVAVAQALKNCVRAGADVVARIGGDEFAVLIAGLDLQQAESRLRGLAASLVAAKFEMPTHAPLKLTVSCGVAEFSAGDTAESLMERADIALYEAKRLGKNRVVTRAKPTLRDMLKH